MPRRSANRHLRHARPRVLACRRGSPSLEFALLLPVMATLLTGGYDIAKILVEWSRVATAAREIALIATEQATQAGTTPALTPAQAYQAMTAVYAFLPQLKTAPASSYSVTLSSVVFTASPTNCTPGVNCVYTAHTAWSVPLSLGSQVARPCGTLTQVSPSVTGSLTTVPTAGMTALTSVLIADVSMSFTPLAVSYLTGTITMKRSAYLPPRLGSASYVEYDVANASTDSAVCSGYL